MTLSWNGARILALADFHCVRGLMSHELPQAAGARVRITKRDKLALLRVEHCKLVTTH